jgi:N6-L-threonylcarbamoyladenine synthase
MTAPSPLEAPILGVESSCDELAAAVLAPDGVTLLSSVVRSQVDIHCAYGGVVPEVASRDHARHVGHVIRAALDAAGLGPRALSGIAVTSGPGLIGSLLCGLEAAKGLALALGCPLVGVNHLEGHVAAAALEAPAAEPPFVALIVSGGHTSLVHVGAWGGPYRVLGQTRDDAAGEAFDKVAKLLGLGYPGGAAIDRLAARGDAKRFAFPKPMPGRDNLDFSFSGLKTAAARLLTEAGALDDAGRADFAASFQHALVENLLKKSTRALELSGTRHLVLAGGVAANSRLRARAAERARREGFRVTIPTRANCTDNAAMIARAGWVRLVAGERAPLDLGGRAAWPLGSVEPPR